jgi:hypothetical protein
MPRLSLLPFTMLLELAVSVLVTLAFYMLFSILWEIPAPLRSLPGDLKSDVREVYTSCSALSLISFVDYFGTGRTLTGRGSTRHSFVVGHFIAAARDLASHLPPGHIGVISACQSLCGSLSVRADS